MYLLFNIINLACWLVCFIWMYHISSRQDAVLKAISEQGRRIERLSKAEHDLIKEVHPVVGDINDKMDAMAEVVQETSENVKEGVPPPPPKHASR